MNDYIKIEFVNISTDQSDILIALLNEQGFEGYEEGDNNLKAFIREEDFNKESLQEIATSLQLDFTESIVEETNWNQLWESNFEPVTVDDFVTVRADFHVPITNVQFEIIISPKMSFGTGHHATTYMMMQHMKEIDFSNKTVFDFGTGTGVLAILAEKMGANSILAIDNDKWSIENATENFGRNSCRAIELRLSNSADMNGNFDIILANINRNVILDNLSFLSDQIPAEGLLLLSGLMAEDEQVMLTECAKNQLIVKNKTIRDNWLSIRLSKT
jgi:ribosomal protein L11 methyltransferase